MKRTHFFFAACISIFISTAGIHAQKDFTIEEATSGLYTNLSSGNITGLQFRPGTSQYTHTSADRLSHMITDAVSGQQKTLLTLDDIQPLMHSETSTLPAITWLDKEHLTFQQEHSTGDSMTHYFLKLTGDKDNIHFSMAQKTVYPLAKASVFKICPSTRAIAYTRENTLWYADAENNHFLVGESADENIIFGQSVHRNEFGIDGGIFHSPNGQYLAFYKMDQSMVADYPVINWLKQPAENDYIKYPMAGGASHHVTVGIFNTRTKGVHYIKTGVPADQYLTCVTWDPSEDYIYIAVLNREQNHLKLNQYDVRSGELVRTLFEEQHNKYVEPQHALYFLPDKKNFIWMSQRDGYMHMYLYNTSGKLIKQLTKGNWLVQNILGADEKGHEIYFTSTYQGAKSVAINSVSVKNNRMKSYNETLGQGIRSVVCSSDGAYILDNFNNGQTPRVISLLNTRTGHSQTLLRAKDPLEGYNTATVRDVTLTTEEDIELYGKLMLPHDFDSTKKYPVIVYLYNGPHLQLIKNSYPESGNLWYDYMTQKGFIVFSMDGRGSANRGLEFEQAVHRRLGEKESYDQMLGVEYLTSLPYVDKDRMGIYGWSFGGFMTTYIMTKYPEVFKVGVAGGPVIDWSMYEIMYTERYMSSPQHNPEGYHNNNLLLSAKNLKGRLMMIHGTDDDVVVWQHSMNFIKTCVDNGVQLDYFTYPGHAHNVRGKDRAHLLKKIADYFIEHL